MPPSRSGVAGRSAELVALLRARGFDVDVYVQDRSPDEAIARSAHEFPPRHIRSPYELTIFQFGNSSHHDFIWPYALRYPGLVVLHDTRLHHARAAALLRERRAADYRAEFAWNHPALSPDLAELGVAGIDSTLYYGWPMLRALIERSRAVAVHGEGAAQDLREAFARTSPSTELDDRLFTIRLGEGTAWSDEQRLAARRRLRAQYGFGDDDVVFGVFGGLTPEKRLTQIFAAFGTLSQTVRARLLLAGAAAAHYDLAAEITARGLGAAAIVTGYLPSDEDVTAHLAACDVSLNLRWPTARETSGPWLRALAAGLPTIVTDLAHHGDVPSLDPRTWAVNAVGIRGSAPGIRGSGPEVRDSGSGVRGSGSEMALEPVTIAIDVLDEDHSLRLAMRRLARDAELRAQLGAAARAWWGREHSVDMMVDDYVRVLHAAAARPLSYADVPPHMTSDGTRLVRELSGPFGGADALFGDPLLR
jgi:glycosyltransferase involved in cell wall biosynthesis